MSKRTLHPFLITAFPVLALFVHNQFSLYSLPMVFLPLAVCLLGVWAAFYILKRLIKDVKKAAVLVSLVSLVFFSYGHLFQFLVSTFPVFANVSPVLKHLFLMLAAVAVIISFGGFIIRLRQLPHAVTGLLNVIALIAVAQPIIKLCSTEIETYRISRNYRQGVSNIKLPAATAPRPNIYYIMMDMYGRQDMLKNLYGYDNSYFISYLKSKGFFVAGCSQSNYAHTVLQQAATLNMAYVENIPLIKKEKIKRNATLALTNSPVFRYVKQLGYKTVSFDATVVDFVQVKKTDVYYRTPLSFSDFSFDDFHFELIGLTPLRLIPELLDYNQNENNGLHRKKILHGFARLQQMPSLKGPLFVYAHFLAPHNPHVFGRHGEPVNPEYRDVADISITDTAARNEYARLYINELHYINKLLIQTIDTILAQSAEKPVIILQSDHGPDAYMDTRSMQRSNVPERMANLFAANIPCADSSSLYSGITPVNTFRVVFNACFGTGLPLLPDKSFFSVFRTIYDFTEVSDIPCEASRSEE